jgi:hypothetical protein
VPGGKIPEAELKTSIAYGIARKNGQIKEDLLQDIVKDAKVQVKMDQFKDLEKPEVLLPSANPAVPSAAQAAP